MVQTGKFPLKNVQIEFKILTIKPLTVHLSDEVGKKTFHSSVSEDICARDSRNFPFEFPYSRKNACQGCRRPSVGWWVHFFDFIFFSLSVSRSASHIRLVTAKEKILQTIMRSIEQWWLVGCLGGVKTWKRGKVAAATWSEYKQKNGMLMRFDRSSSLVFVFFFLFLWVLTGSGKSHWYDWPHPTHPGQVLFRCETYGRKKLHGQTSRQENVKVMLIDSLHWMLIE